MTEKQFKSKEKRGIDMKINIKCTKATVIRTVLLIAALINNFLTIRGHSVLPIDDEEITQVVSALFTGVTSIMAWWKNNSFTEEAHKADSHLREMKNSKKSKTKEN